MALGYRRVVVCRCDVRACGSAARPRALSGRWVLLILSPTLVVPIVTEVAAERRMYLPLAAIVAWLVLWLTLYERTFPPLWNLLHGPPRAVCGRAVILFVVHAARGLAHSPAWTRG